MKKLLLFAFIIPFVSFGQKIELSGQAGGSLFFPSWSPYDLKTFSGQLAVAYHVSHLLSVSAFYEYDGGNTIANNIVGIAPDVTFKHFYAGSDLVEDNVKTSGDLPYKPSFGFGIHAGAKQKLYKQLFVVEQVGIYNLYLREDSYIYQISYPANYIHSSPSEYIYEPSNTQWQTLPYCRIGLTYKL